MAKASDIHKLAMALPGVLQKPHFGSQSYRAPNGKMFAEANDARNEAILKLSSARQEILFEVRPETFQPAIWGAIRWSRITLNEIDAKELPELVREAYDQVTSAKPSKKKAGKKISARR